MRMHLRFFQSPSPVMCVCQHFQLNTPTITKSHVNAHANMQTTTNLQLSASAAWPPLQQALPGSGMHLPPRLG